MFLPTMSDAPIAPALVGFGRLLGPERQHRGTTHPPPGRAQDASPGAGSLARSLAHCSACLSLSGESQPQGWLLVW
jgi:hypothetical protein